MCQQSLERPDLRGLTISTKEDHEGVIVDEFDILDFAATELDGNSLHGADRMLNIIEYVAMDNAMEPY